MLECDFRLVRDGSVYKEKSCKALTLRFLMEKMVRFKSDKRQHTF